LGILVRITIHECERGTRIYIDLAAQRNARFSVNQQYPTSGRRVLSYFVLKSRGIRFSRVHLTRLERAGKFPHHIDLGENSIGWFEDEIDGYLEEKAAARPVVMTPAACAECDVPQNAERKCPADD
jgi:prophage regulatory protein